MQKRLPTLVTAFLLLFSAIMPATGVQAFSDVDSTRYGEAYAFLQNRGAVSGYSDGSGRPYDSINRAEALKVVLEMQGRYGDRVEWYRNHLSSLPLFVDYRQQDWFAPYVEAGFEASILRGYPDRTFRPGQPVRVEEALAMIFRSYGDNPTAGGQWYDGYVNSAIERNLVYYQERLTLGTPITRGQFFDILYRYESVRSQNITAYRDPVQQNPVATGNPTPIVRTQNPSPVSGVSTVATGDDRQHASQKNFAITIPRLGITDLSITHPADALTSKGQLAVLQYGVGHLFSYPGRGGKIMVYGHSSSYAWDVSQYTKIFTKVNQLQAGDRIYVTYEGTLYVYQVTGQQTISPTDIAPFQGRGEELILYTCWPVGTTKSRLLVHASPVTTVALR